MPILVARGAHANARDFLGRTPLLLAVAHKENVVAEQFLLSTCAVRCAAAAPGLNYLAHPVSDVDIDQHDHEGKTALYEAARVDNVRGSARS